MNSAFKGRIYQQLRLFDKIERKYVTLMSKTNLTYLFFLHLISGIGQSSQGGFTCEEYAKIDLNKYGKYIKDFGKIRHIFYKNENASVPGKMRIHFFIWMMRLKKYRIAGKVMGLR